MFEREDKFIVMKRSDCAEYLTPLERTKLGEMLESIKLCRKHDGKNPQNCYVVVNEDEPYAEIVWKLIELWEVSKREK